MYCILTLFFVILLIYKIVIDAREDERTGRKSIAYLTEREEEEEYK